MSKVIEAVESFRSGYACSQAILATYGAPLGLDHDSALRLAAGFAGGMRLGETCGAVTGAFMVLGLRHAGRESSTPAGRAEVYARVTEFAQAFERIHGALHCRELLGCDIGTPEGMAQAREQSLFRAVCPRLVQTAAELLEAMSVSSLI